MPPHRDPASRGLWILQQNTVRFRVLYGGTVRFRSLSESGLLSKIESPPCLDYRWYYSITFFTMRAYLSTLRPPDRRGAYPDNAR